ncbi:MAG: class I SAM-dependent methyltransferase [Alphaproteobacteria bacterium]|nr:class I SAM-dependent methyltransferase [Alphaproteobacteria bacterium]
MTKPARNIKDLPVKPDPQTLDRLGSLAYRNGDFKRALECFGALVETGRHNRDHAIRLAHLLKNVTFKTFSSRWKDTILKTLRTSGLNYQDLSRSWASLFNSDPDFSVLHDLAAGREAHRGALKKALNDPFLIEGLEKLVICDMKFENMLTALSQRTEFETHPKIKKAFRMYSARTENIFLDSPLRQAPPPEAEIIPSLGASENKVSQNVRNHYEEHPYPRWTFIHCQTPSKEQAKFYHRRLIAGCGTGFGACSAALRYPNAQITAFDISRASLTYACHKANELGLKNIKFLQADILNLEKLEEDFDIIECTGVLHHMENPQKGLSALCANLKPGGKILIGLYSEAGRRDISAARKLIAEDSLKPAHADIKKAREMIATLPENHPAKKVSTRHDFYSLSNCRDLLFHAHEINFTVKELEKLVRNAGLSLLRFEHPNLPIKSFKDASETEAKDPDTFRAMYIFWCVKPEQS